MAEFIMPSMAKQESVEDLSEHIVCYEASCEISSVNTQTNFYFILPTGVDNTYRAIVSLAAPVNTADYSARVFAVITNGKLRIGIKADKAQIYYVNVMFVKYKIRLTATTE